MRESIRCSVSRSRLPRGTIVSLFSRIRTSPRAISAPLLVAGPNPTFCEPSSTRMRPSRFDSSSRYPTVPSVDPLSTTTISHAGETAASRLSRHSRVNTRPSSVTMTMLARGTQGAGRDVRTVRSSGVSSTARTVASGSVVGHLEVGVSTRDGGKGPALVFTSVRATLSLRPQPDFRQHAREHDVVTEAVARDGGRRAAVALVVRIDALDRVEDLLHRREAEQPFAGWQVIAESGFLRDHRPACRKVGCRSIAEPAAARPCVLILGDSELSARPADVLSVPVEIARQARRVPHLPTLAFEQEAV